jgi:diguanylate cyclase (GGDEF)-like protein/PAS domain S-box-containing protein
MSSAIPPAGEAQSLKARDVGLKAQMLLPLGVVLALLLVAFVATFYLEEKEHLAEEFRRDLKVMQEFHAEILGEKTRELAAEARMLLRDARLAGALAARDRATLARLGRPYLEEMKAGFGFTHLYFLDPERVIVLRAHLPDWQGDRVVRQTALEAERTLKPASGTEVGPAGTLTLRHVTPWHRDGRLIGYLEIGMDIERLLVHALEAFKVEAVALLGKEHLERADWERGMRMLGRAADWEQFEACATAFQTLPEIASGLRERIASQCRDPDPASFEIALDGRNHYGSFIPLPDARSREVGKLLVLRDVSELQRDFNAVLARLALASVAVGLILFAVFYYILDGIERQLARKRLLLRESRGALEQAQREWVTAFDAVQDVVFLHDRELCVMRANRAYLEHAGKSLKEIVGRPYWETFPGMRGPMPGCLHALHEGTSDEEELALEGRIFLCRNYPVSGAGGEYLYSLHIMQDITERKRYEAELHHRATHDGLTGLPNRYLLTDRLEQALVHASRAGRHVAVLVLDLDRFKTVNDGLGHGTGDQVLKQIAARLARCLREGDTLARFGGDEFVAVLVDVARLDDVALVGQKILRALAHPLSIDGQELVTTTSIGAAVYPRDGGDAETLLRHADIAMYRAKERGRDNLQFYTQEMNVRTRESFEIETELRRALEREEFLLYYQPQVDLLSGRITGAEALIRWRHPARGMVPPDRFIPLAEETGLIAPIGEWVLDSACEQARRWQDEGLPPIRIAINLSARQLRQSHLARLVRQALWVNGLEARYLELELTESAVTHDPEEAAARLRELSATGVGIALDDFGTGYSSLNHLKRFPISRLKIDRSFVRGIAANLDDAAIVSATVAMAHGLGIEVIAEGVETGEQLNYLRQRHCDQAQGYYFSRPLPAGEFAALLLRGEPLPPTVEAQPSQQSG